MDRIGRGDGADEHCTEPSRLGSAADRSRVQVRLVRQAEPVLIAEEHADLVDSFSAPANVFDDFRRADEIAYEQRALAAEARLRVEDAREDVLRADIQEIIKEVSAEIAPFRHSLLETNRKPPFWTRLLFRSTGKPKKMVRYVLFRTSGKPRGIFRGLILKKDGTPHSLFRTWMFSPEYQALRSAVRFEGISPFGRAR